MSDPIPFDAHAPLYDAWFLKNQTVLASEVRLVQAALGEPGRCLSVGCGSGLFESVLRSRGVVIAEGVEPAEPMAAIARERGLDVRAGTAQSLPFGEGEFDTVLMNGVPSYLNELGPAFREAFRVLRSGGRVVVCDVPGSGSYGMLYQLAARVGSWEAPELRGVAPESPYPIEFVRGAHWRPTEEIASALKQCGFTGIEHMQTLLTHPKYSNDAVQDPIPGCDRGDYVATRARKP